MAADPRIFVDAQAPSVLAISNSASVHGGKHVASVCSLYGA